MGTRLGRLWPPPEPLPRHLARAVLDAFFPPACVDCGRPGSPFCMGCLAAFPIPDLHPSQDDRLTAWGSTAVFGGAIRDALHALKYEGERRMAGPLGARIAAVWRAAGWPVQVVMPVPLSEGRVKERGYNQAALLAGAMAWRAGLPYADGLRRTRETHTQVGLGRAARQENVAGAFAADPSVVRGRAVLLIDDVLTTGATLRACAAALWSVGAKAVYALTVAEAPAP